MHRRGIARRRTGPVVQRSRTPPCQGGGRGFKYRPGRQAGPQLNRQSTGLQSRALRVRVLPGLPGDEENIMGLDTSHDCWHGSYGVFHRWRLKVAEIAGYGSLDNWAGFGGQWLWPGADEDPLVLLLHHSDCDGEIRWQDAAPIANRLVELLPALRRADWVAGVAAGSDERVAEFYHERTEHFIAGLRLASRRREDVEFA